VALAFDPKDKAILYAGTPHLPGKTSDGGVSWNSIHRGMIELRCLLDPSRPQLAATAFSRVLAAAQKFEWRRPVDQADGCQTSYALVHDVQNEDTWFGTSRVFFDRLREAPHGGESAAFEPVPLRLTPVIRGGC
jgi:hypothetical protein